MWQCLMNFTSNMVVSYENYLNYFFLNSFIMQVSLLIVDIYCLLFLVIYRTNKIFLGVIFLII